MNARLFVAAGESEMKPEADLVLFMVSVYNYWGKSD